MAADARRLLNQINLETGGGKIKGGLNAADPSTDNHNISKVRIIRTVIKLLRFLQRYYSVIHFLSPLEVWFDVLRLVVVKSD